MLQSPAPTQALANDNHSRLIYARGHTYFVYRSRAQPEAGMSAALAEAPQIPFLDRSAFGRGAPPRALTEIRLAAILDQIAIGVPPQTAAQAAGVPVQTWKDWLAKGRAEGAKEPYLSAVRRVEAARSFYQASRMHVLHEAAPKDARVAMWELERGFPNDFGQVTRSEMAVTVRPMLDASKYTPEQLGQLLELLRIGAPAVEELPADGRPALELLAGETS